VGATLYGATGPTSPSQLKARRALTLPIVYQQLLTATVRVRSDRQSVTDSHVFRSNIRAAIQAAEKEGVGKGYIPEDVRLATVAVVAFLDESILTSPNPVFSDWSRMSLQQELFGHNVAGESFYENLETLQKRNDSADLADILELYCLCLLLGFRGRYALSGIESIRPLTDSIMSRIRRIRGPLVALSPSWSVPSIPVAIPRRDPWIRRLAFAAVISLSVALLLFAGFLILLESGISSLRSISVLLPI
jgi:type VI secretion system protein ImpK